MDNSIAELERVPLRNQWPDEESDFTPWLAENIEHLSEVLDVELQVEDTEANVGGFYADIYATDLEGEREIIIENQYNKSDHKHLGQSIVYAGGFDADIVVWVAEEFDDAHIDAIQWINERTDDETGVFGIEVRLVQIADSPVAPTFNIVERPSSWKVITGDLDETDRKHRKFWLNFEDRLRERGLEEFIMGSGGKVATASYVTKRYDGAYIRPAATLHDNIYCMLRIIDESGEFGGITKEKITDELLTAFADMDDPEISRSEVENIEWESVPGQKYDKIWLRHSGPIDRSDRENWQQYHDWIIDASLLYDDVFATYF